jgi:WD40 repeat protein
LRQWDKEQVIVGFAEDGKTLILRAEDEHWVLHDVVSNKVVRTVGLPKAAKETVDVWSKDATHVITRDEDYRFGVWDLTQGKKVATLALDWKVVQGLGFSPDRRLVAAACRDGRILLVDAQTGKVLGTGTGHAGPLYALAFSADGRWLATGGEDTTVVVWEVDRLAKR